MKIVKIYKVTCTNAYRLEEQQTGYQLTPWGEDTLYYQGFDDGGVNYRIPSGYTVKKYANQPGQGIFFGNTHCDIKMHSSGRPQLICGGHQMPVLQPV